MTKKLLIVGAVLVASLVTSQAFASAPWDHNGPVASDPTIPEIVKEASLRI